MHSVLCVPFFNIVCFHVLKVSYVCPSCSNFDSDSDSPAPSSAFRLGGVADIGV